MVYLLVPTFTAVLIAVFTALELDFKPFLAILVVETPSTRKEVAIERVRERRMWIKKYAGEKIMWGDPLTDFHIIPSCSRRRNSFEQRFHVSQLAISNARDTFLGYRGGRTDPSSIRMDRVLLLKSGREEREIKGVR